MKRILVGSPVRQAPRVLKEFLDGLRCLDASGLTLGYRFADDCDDPESSALLGDFVEIRKRAEIVDYRGESGRPPAYERQEHGTHIWDVGLVRRVAEMKDEIIAAALAGPWDAVFLVDADLVLQPQTLRALVAAGKPIVSEVFWTRWRPEIEPGPNVFSWCNDLPTLPPLRQPGLYRVRGAGACTLIAREVLEAGVRFDRHPRCNELGEDRDFALWLEDAGFDWWIDTHRPPFHIYREADLRRLEAWRAAPDEKPEVWPEPQRPSAQPLGGVLLFNRRFLGGGHVSLVDDGRTRQFPVVGGVAAIPAHLAGRLFVGAGWEPFTGQVDVNVERLGEFIDATDLNARCR